VGSSDSGLIGGVCLLMGAYFLWIAWTTLVAKRSVLPPMAVVGLWVLRTFKSEGAARKQEARLRSAGRMKLYGFSALFGGLIFIWLALLTFQRTLFQVK